MYNGDITAGIPEPELNSFQDVYDSGYTLLYLKDSAEEAVLSSGPEGSPKQNVYKQRSRGMGSHTEFLQAMLTEDRVVVFNFHESYSTIGALKSNMKFRESVVIQSAFAFPLDSSLLKLFNFHLSRVRDQGVWDHILHQWKYGRKPSDLSHRIFSGEAAPLGYDNLIFPVLFLLGGVGLALLLWIPEK